MDFTLLKQQILTRRFGRWVLHKRDAVSLVWAAHTMAEDVGSLSNDHLATHLVCAMAIPGSTFVDVGAHIGSIIADVRYTVPTAKIVAIEAVPDKVVALRKYFPNVELHGCAVGETSGEVDFFVNEKQSGYSSLAETTPVKDAVLKKIVVPLRRLDDLIQATDVSVIKIDVEGAELGVLRGARDIIMRCRPLVMFESGPNVDPTLGYTKEAMHAFFESVDMDLVVPNRLAHAGPALSLEAFLDSHVYPRRTTNYFAVPREHIAEHRERAKRATGGVSLRIN
jgi:FkbM family methyltransferase